MRLARVSQVSQGTHYPRLKQMGKQKWHYDVCPLCTPLPGALSVLRGPCLALEVSMCSECVPVVSQVCSECAL